MSATSDDVPGLDALLQQAMKLQEQLLAAQAEAQAAEVEGRAGGTAVRVTMTGAGEVRRVRIDPSVVDAAEVDLLEDLIVAALHDAAHKARDLHAAAMGDLGDLGGLGGLGELGGLGAGLSDSSRPDETGQLAHGDPG